uniref:Uncharacterized protein n=1 Tax=Globisporangium ultimum (strain ATCC 200006 / CBS 805.95 / DAOM BR144) TaxID=431595 RepID=K3X8U8_GLOUD
MDTRVVHDAVAAAQQQQQSADEDASVVVSTHEVVIAAVASSAGGSGVHHAHHHPHALIDESQLDKYDDELTATRKRELDGGDDDYDDDDDDASTEYGGTGGKDTGKRGAGTTGKRARRHNWQQKYETEFGLVAIERDAVTGDVALAMCGFCKAFGREGKYEQLLQSDADGANASSGESKKRRRRSLTTTKFFRAFRVDNIRSHLQGAHPRRWAEFEMLPKQDAVRARFLQSQGEISYDSLQMVDDVVLTGSALNAESDMYAQAQAQAQALAAAHHHATPATAALAEAPSPHEVHHHHQQHNQHNAHAHHQSAAAPSSSATVTATSATHQLAAMQQAYFGTRTAFDYEKHLMEQLALEREKFEFEKAKFKKEAELRERDLALREKQLEQDRVLHEKRHEAAVEAAQQENSKFFRLAEVLRDAVASAVAASGGGNVVPQGSSVV